MTGRGSGRLIVPYKNAEVAIGITLSTLPPALPANSNALFYIVITARLLTSPRPDSPIVFMAHFNPFAHLLDNRSIENAKCISPPVSAEAGKQIEIWPSGWQNHNTGDKDLRNKFEFLTIYPNRALEVRHEMRRDRIIATGVEKGEVYRVSLTDKALGTWWWCFGDLEKMEGVKFRSKESEKYWDDGEEDEDEGREKEGVWVTSEAPGNLALVVEKGEVEFEVV